MEGSNSGLARTSEGLPGARADPSTPRAEGDPSLPRQEMPEGRLARLQPAGEVVPEDSVRPQEAFQEEVFTEVVSATAHLSVDFMVAASLTAAVSRMGVASGGIDESRTQRRRDHLTFPSLVVQ